MIRIMVKAARTGIITTTARSLQRLPRQRGCLDHRRVTPVCTGRMQPCPAGLAGSPSLAVSHGNVRRGSGSDSGNPGTGHRAPSLPAYGSRALAGFEFHFGKVRVSIGPGFGFGPDGGRTTCLESF